MERASSKDRILVIATHKRNAGWGKFYENSFTRLGHEVKLLSHGMDEQIKANASLDQRIKAAIFTRSKKGHEIIFKKIHERMIQEVRALKPNLLISTCGPILPPRFVEECKSICGALFFQLLPDHPMYLYGQKFISFFLDNLPCYDCTFTFIRSSIPGLYQLGAPRVEYLQFAHDQYIHRPVELSPAEFDIFKNDIAYIGNWGPFKEAWATHLAPCGLKIWGENWDHGDWGSPSKKCWQKPGREELGLGGDMAKVCAATKVIFNLIMVENECAHSLKTFEIPACGGFMLTNRTDEQLEILEEDRHAAYYSTKEELLDKLDFYLKHDETRKKISRAGRERVKGETYDKRAEKIMKIYKEMKCQ